MYSVHNEPGTTAKASPQIFLVIRAATQCLLGVLNHAWLDRCYCFRQLATTLTDGDDNFWLAKRFIQDSARTTVCIDELLPLLPAELRGWRPTASSNHCFMIASFRERLDHGRAPVVSRFQDMSERLFDFVMVPTLA